MSGGLSRMNSELSSGSELDVVRERVDGTIKCLADLFSAAAKPLPTQSGNGQYLEPDPPDLLERIQNDIQNLSHLGVRDVSTLLQVQKNNLGGTLTDDKHYLLEGLLNVSIPSFAPCNSINVYVDRGQIATSVYNCK